MLLAARAYALRKPTLAAVRMLRGPSSRLVHTRRALRYPLENGVGDFLPAEALKVVVEWQDGLLQRLNDQIKGTRFTRKNVLQTIIETSDELENILIFNTASLAANNSFFLDSLKPPREGTSNEEYIDPILESSIIQSFGTLDQLKERFIASASGMASSGWLWLVTDGLDRLAVLPTFGAGTLLVRSRNIMPEIHQALLARQEVAPSSVSSVSTIETTSRSSSSSASLNTCTASLTSPVSGVAAADSRPLKLLTSSRSLHVTTVSAMSAETFNTDADVACQTAQSLDARIFPLLCLSIHEHAWMSAGLNVWGKEEYVRRFFSVVDWEKLSNTYAKFHRANARELALS